MNIPKSVNVGAFRIPVVFSDDRIVEVTENNTGMCFGMCETSLDGGRIVLREGMSEDREGETFMHEVIEAIVSNYCLEIEHPILSTLSMALYRALKDGKCLA